MMKMRTVPEEVMSSPYIENVDPYDPPLDFLHQWLTGSQILKCSSTVGLVSFSNKKIIK